MRTRALFVLVALLGGCANRSGGGTGNVVDAVVAPMLQKDGVKPTVAGDTELCRRYAIDLSGVAPSWDEYVAHCRGKSPSEIVDYFMAQPDYVRVNQRLWADAFQYDNRTVWYQYLQDLDAQVGALYRGELGYPDFAAIAMTHPAFVGEFVGENVVAYGYQALLGRDALPEERSDMLSLYRMWRSRPAYDASIGAFRYNACASDADCSAGRTCQPLPSGASKVCTDTSNYRELYLEPRACAGAFGAINCTSAAHDASAILAGSAPIALGDLTADQWNVVRTPGRVITQQRYFYEAAADRTLAKYLGWWHLGVELPGYEIPAVRQALATLLAQKGDLRAMERELLTSVLYTMPADNSGADTVLWHHGPTKQMIAESWIDSVGKFTGVALGACDWRYPLQSLRWLPASLFPPAGALPSFAYQATARTMGGCPDQKTQSRYTDVGVLYAMEQRSLLAAACSDKSASKVAAAASATALVQSAYREALTWDPPADELKAVAATLPAGDKPTAQQLCQAILRSSRFLFY
ncbi:MAG: hypothetical protein JWN44_1321 [Myxococcales bacterium]|nr:hypothetical protein [Myxococcales bacterium]